MFNPFSTRLLYLNSNINFQIFKSDLMFHRHFPVSELISILSWNTCNDKNDFECPYVNIYNVLEKLGSINMDIRRY